MAKPPNASPRTRGTGRDPAQNARRHGLTAPACPNDALAHYRLILGNARRTRASYATDEVDRLAYMLAEAEARVERATAAERAHLFGRFSHAGIQAQGGDVFEPVAEDVLSVEVLRQIVLSDGPDIAQRVAAAQNQHSGVGPTSWPGIGAKRRRPGAGRCVPMPALWRQRTPPRGSGSARRSSRAAHTSVAGWRFAPARNTLFETMRHMISRGGGHVAAGYPLGPSALLRPRQASGFPKRAEFLPRVVCPLRAHAIPDNASSLCTSKGIHRRSEF